MDENYTNYETVMEKHMNELVTIFISFVDYYVNGH